MKKFKFEIELSNKIKKEIREVKANHLQGAIRQLWQNEANMVRVVRILEG